MTLANRNLVEADFSGASLAGASLYGSNLERASFYCADLRDADFSNADLRGASLRGAKLAHARFEKTNLGRLALTSGSALPPDLTGAEATSEQFHGAMLDDKLADLGLAVKAKG